MKSARVRYLEGLYPSQPMSAMTVSFQAQLYEYAESIGLCPECSAKAAEQDPLRTLPPQDGERDRLREMIEQATDDIDMLRVLAARTEAIS